LPDQAGSGALACHLFADSSFPPTYEKDYYGARLALGAALVLAASPASFGQRLGLEPRIDSLLRAMSTEEKLAQLANNSFMATPDNARLRIPGFVMDDGPHGVRFQKTTAWPTGMDLVSTWDRHLAQQVGQAMGEEFWAFGKQQLGPCIDLMQDPRAGRSAEGSGEDPFLIGQVTSHVAKGIQTTPVIATVKHWAARSPCKRPRPGPI